MLSKSTFIYLFLVYLFIKVFDLTSKDNTIKKKKVNPIHNKFNIYAKSHKNEKKNDAFLL